MTDHISETALDHYMLGGDDVDVDAIERHILGCEPCACRVRQELELELQLGEVAAGATFCPGCGRVVSGDRCDDCGATRIAGEYHIERVLVRTTHGRLYVALDAHGNRVALKELAFVQAPTLEALAAFDRETKFLRALAHPCIPRFHASFIEGSGIHTRMYIAQDLVEGESLLGKLPTHWFDEREIIGIARRVLEILVYLQGLSPIVFHRDIKPANLIARADGSIALVDFGAARDVSETMGNTAVGTFGYMPVEQMAGIFDATTDTYALGASLLHLLTRREPWKLLESGPIGLNVSPNLRRFLHRLVARKPKDRFPTARDALDALNSLPVPRRFSVKRVAVIAAVVCATGVGGGIATAVLAADDDRPDARPETSRVVHESKPQPTQMPTLKRWDSLERPIVKKRPAKDDVIYPESGHCPAEERLPSGKCATTPRMLVPRTVPAEIEAVLRRIESASVATGLRSQILRAVDGANKAGRGSVIVGRIVVAGSDPRDVTTLARTLEGGYFAASTARGPIEFMLHGYNRVRFERSVPDATISWIGDVTLYRLPMAKTARLVGRVVTSTAGLTLKAHIRSDIMHGTMALHPDDRNAGARFPDGVELRLDSEGRFSGSGFTPGTYQLLLMEGSKVRNHKNVVFEANKRLDVGEIF